MWVSDPCPISRAQPSFVPEAVGLVPHSGAIGHGGDLCILEMGEQVRIVDLAENMIRMTGKVPYDEVDIQFTGIRAGRGAETSPDHVPTTDYHWSSSPVPPARTCNSSASRPFSSRASALS